MLAGRELCGVHCDRTGESTRSPRRRSVLWSFHRLDHSERLRGVIVSDQMLALFGDTDWTLVFSSRPVLRGATPEACPPTSARPAQVNLEVVIALASTWDPQNPLVCAAWSV